MLETGAWKRDVWPLIRLYRAAALYMALYSVEALGLGSLLGLLWVVVGTEKYPVLCERLCGEHHRHSRNHNFRMTARYLL